MMTSADIRTRFLDFFKSPLGDHIIVPSDSLIPSGDPTVLFTSAGMNQFKDYFLGKRTDLTRAASCQKCLRTGDLEKVGKTPSHHSFFEMLGNFSFGDYFKREAIQWAWEFLTGTTNYVGTKKSETPQLCLPLPASKLWVSVYEDDQEAFDLWRKVGVPAARLKRFGQADNFWPANAPSQGPNGPCGPCSEIYYDPDGRMDPKTSVELWNLVFTQFDRQPDGSLAKLPRPNIDTGMGLERLTRVIQGVETDYETDLFQPIVKSIYQLFFTGLKQLQGEDRSTIWTIADHLRAIVFLLSENLIPSNEGRGYVLRMLIRRAHWHGGRLLTDRKSKVGDTEERLTPFLADIASSVIDLYKPVYSELKKQQEFILKALRTEENRFIETLDSGKGQIDAELQRLAKQGSREISGDFAFKLKDTYGYPIELLADIAHRRGFAIDRNIFKERLTEQRERSRAGSQFGGDIFVPTTLKLEGARTSDFIGYDALEGEARVKGIWKENQWVQQAASGDEIGLILDRSPFYGEAGGQVGDHGVIESPKGALEVANATWADEFLVHHAKIVHGSISVNDPVRAKVNRERRLKVARSHTATHLLHWALRKVLGEETVQAGSLVEAERIRFDFSALGSLHEEQQATVEQLVNDRIRAADEVGTRLMKLEEAKRAGALALFGEKYSQQVRVVSIGDYSRELCGGTHLAHTGSIGTFCIAAESSIAAGTRRIEALVGAAAVERHQHESRLLHEAAKRLSRPAQEVVKGLEELVDQLKRAEQTRKALQEQWARVEAKQLLGEGKKIGDVTFVSAAIQHVDREALATLADAVKELLQRDGIVLLASSDGASQVSLVMAATANLVKRVHVGQILKAIVPLTQGSGGGRPEFAQGGGKDPSGIPAALKRAEELLREALAR